MNDICEPDHLIVIMYRFYRKKTSSINQTYRRLRNIYLFDLFWPFYLN